MEPLQPSRFEVLEVPHRVQMLLSRHLSHGTLLRLLASIPFIGMVSWFGLARVCFWFLALRAMARTSRIGRNRNRLPAFPLSTWDRLRTLDRGNRRDFL